MTATTLAFPTPTSLGSLDHYVQAVNRFPLLTAAQEVELGRRLQRDNDVDAARQLVLSHLRLVVSVSRKYSGYGLPQADLIQEGNIGLMKAVRRFDPERGVRLVSFALHWIKAALSVKPEEVIEMETRLSGQDVALDPPVGEQGEVMTPIAYLTDAEAEPVQILERAETERNRSEGLRHALSQLDDRSRGIIEARWLREDDQATLQDLADQYGVSAERIRQIESKALKVMRGQIGAS